jgi:protein phosphatase
MTITIPEPSLVVLVGPSGAGKSTFARRHFGETEIVSSDRYRALVSDDENSMAATDDAFEVLHLVARKRLAAGRLTVVDATNLLPEWRRPLVALAQELHRPAVAIVLDMPEEVCLERNRARTARSLGAQVVRRQAQELRRGLRGIDREGFGHVHVLHGAGEIDGAVVERQPIPQLNR